jgi:hypothetical protein
MEETRMKWEYDFIVFELEKGPKIIKEALNTHGEEGWELCSLLPVAGVRLVAYVKRAIEDKPKSTDDQKKKELLNLWSDKS